MTVTRREPFVGVHTVFDLGVEADVHTFVAEGFVVHNEQAPLCLTADGGSVSPYDAPEDRPRCVCTDGQIGRWTCDSAPTAATCELCAPGDGGT